MEKIEPIPCMNCGRLPKIVILPGELYYAQCNCFRVYERKNKKGVMETHSERVHNQYDYLGYNESACIAAWNDANTLFGRRTKTH